MSEDKSPTIIDLLQKVCDIMESRELAEVYLREGEITLRVRRAVLPTTEPVQVGASSSIAPSPQKTGEILRAPMPGVFYLAPSPEEPPFVKVGSVISEDDTLCVIEAMKIFNEVKADFPCEILEILVEDAAAVGFDHPLFRVKRI
jgi:acetyl-CoA carboxylase biotin carboxyl carrier protein